MKVDLKKYNAKLNRLINKFLKDIPLQQEVILLFEKISYEVAYNVKEYESEYRKIIKKSEYKVLKKDLKLKEEKDKIIIYYKSINLIEKADDDSQPIKNFLNTDKPIFHKLDNKLYDLIEYSFTERIDLKYTPLPSKEKIKKLFLNIKIKREQDKKIANKELILCNTMCNKLNKIVFNNLLISIAEIKRLKKTKNEAHIAKLSVYNFIKELFNKWFLHRNINLQTSLKHKLILFGGSKNEFLKDIIVKQYKDDLKSDKRKYKSEHDCLKSIYPQYIFNYEWTFEKAYNYLKKLD